MGWGTHVHPWQILVNVWQNKYNIVKSKINKTETKNKTKTRSYYIAWVITFNLLINCNGKEYEKEYIYV